MDTPSTTAPRAAAPVLTDRERLREIAALRLLDPDLSPALQDAVRDAAARFDLPVALVSVVLNDAQHFAAMHGLSDWMAEAGGTPIEFSFCRHAVESGAPFIVEEAAEHPLTRDNPLVALEDVRCYAGIPLITSRGHAVGSLCVIGGESRSFSVEDVEALRAAADDVVRRLEARRAA